MSITDYKVLTREFYLREPVLVAGELLGKYLIHKINGGIIVGRIIETEAYMGRIDKASHAYNYKKTPRTEIMFREGGIAYVYFIYGMYYCFNVVTDKEGEPSAALIRGVQITEGEDIASLLRYREEYNAISKRKRAGMSDGPGKLCRAFGITKEHNGADLIKGNLLIAEKPGESYENFYIEKSRRIGIDYAEEAKDFLWRFMLKQK